MENKTTKLKKHPQFQISEQYEVDVEFTKFKHKWKLLDWSVARVSCLLQDITNIYKSGKPWENTITCHGFFSFYQYQCRGLGNGNAKTQCCLFTQTLSIVWEEAYWDWYVVISFFLYNILILKNRYFSFCHVMPKYLLCHGSKATYKNFKN